MGGRGASFNADAQAVRQALKTYEDQIRDRKTERAVAIDSKGNVVLNKTDRKKGSVSFNAAEQAKFRDAIVTHNHPNGQTFSDADLYLAYATGAREIRACHTNGYYSLKRNFELGSVIPSNYSDFSRDYEKAAKAYIKTTVDPIWNSSQQDKAACDKCNGMVYKFRRDWLRKHAKSYGWTYTEGGK